MTRLSAPPLALYAHFPWCVRKCPYCDFNSHRAPAEIPEQQYVDALLEDLGHDLTLTPSRPLVSIFLGGGTPSLFSPEALQRFLSGVRALVASDDALEVTMEANPGTVEHGRFAEYRDAGVNRVSLGAQSFDDEQLKKLGRIHSSSEIRKAAEELHRAGMTNFNIDLMYGLPGQSLREARADVEAAISLEPTHISHYQLTLEPGTAFFHQPPVLPATDELWDMQCACQAQLAQAGFEQYEVSAYARTGRRCIHNLNYWEFGDYFGLGAGAHGKLTQPPTLQRTERRKQPRDYLSHPAAERVIANRAVPEIERSFEFMLNALRLRQGFSRALFETRTGVRWDVLLPLLQGANEKGLLRELRPEYWVSTDLGWRFLNDLQAQFLP